VDYAADQGKQMHCSPWSVSEGPPWAYRHDLLLEGYSHMSDVVKSPTRLFNDDQMSEISTFADVEKAIAERGLGVLDFSDFGTGFAVLTTEEKRTLVGTPCAIIDWRFNFDDENGGEFVSLSIVTEDGRKVIVNDGSTGIYAQMSKLEEKNPGVRGVIKLRKGFTVSDYTHVDEKGKKTPATTYYLSTSK
jgi:hypothetical protein